MQLDFPSNNSFPAQDILKECFSLAFAVKLLNSFALLACQSQVCCGPLCPFWNVEVIIQKVYFG